MEANLCLGFLYIFIMKLHLRRTMAKNCCSFPFSSSSLICNELANCLLCFLIITINLNEIEMANQNIISKKKWIIFVFFFQCKHFSFNQLTISIANNFSIMLIIYLYIFFQFACISLVYLSIYIDDFSNNFETIVEATL